MHCVIIGMKFIFLLFSTCVLLSLNLETQAMVANENGSDWQQLASIPNELGLAGLVVGQHEGGLIAAGGTNFPDATSTVRGQKKTYSDIYLYHSSSNTWSKAGDLPEPRGYGAVVSLPEGILVMGGENAEKLFADSIWLRREGDRVRAEQGPLLPEALTSSMAVVSGHHVYLAGGYLAGKPRRSHAGFWRLDLNRLTADWESLKSWDGPTRGQGVIAATEEAIYLFSGLEITLAEDSTTQVSYLTDAYRYDIVGSEWKRLPEMPRSTIAAPTPAPMTQDGDRIYLLGGVDGSLAGKQPKGTRVPDGILYFDISTETWHEYEESWPESVVTTPTVKWHDQWVLVSGEIKSGVRSPHVWTWSIPDPQDSND